MKDIINSIRSFGILPVIKIQDATKASPLADALTAGDLPCAEVTFRTSSARDAIFAMKNAHPDMLIGAGTVLTTKQVDEAVDAGASFIVSPGLNERTVTYCLEKDIPIIPGTATPSDLEKAIALGLSVVKFFPAEANGGVKMLKAMSAPYGNLSFMPTGGITTDNMLDYLSLDNVVCCGGSFMVKDEWLENSNFTAVTDICRATVKKLHGFSLMHIGMNHASAEDAEQTVRLFSLMGFDTHENTGAYFMDNCLEVMKSAPRGKNGHIAIATNDIDRAVAYLSRKGFAFDKDSYMSDSKGKHTFIYLRDEIGGFAVHLKIR